MSFDDDLDFENEFQPVDIRYLRQHIKQLAMQIDGTKIDGFTDEFNKIERIGEYLLATYDYEAAELEINKKKNRYGNVMPWDHTRVKLPEDDSSTSDYINANHINLSESTNGFNEGSKRYIASQGPLQSTTIDFWRMVWHEKLRVLVMLTRLKENDRFKCYRYWPEDGTETYGGVEVTLLDKTNVCDSIVRRKFKVNNISNDEVREVVQFQYEEWPDHGTPQSSHRFRQLLDRVDDDQKGSTAPILVHCSAGIGRSGTFCTVHSILHAIRATAPSESYVLNLPEVVLALRKDRAGMVQTKEQYWFCYQAILEALEEEFPERLTDDMPSPQKEKVETRPSFQFESSDEEEEEQNLADIRAAYRARRL